MNWWDDTGTAGGPPEDGPPVTQPHIGNVPTGGAGKPRALVTAGLALAGVVMLAGGIGVLLLLRGPEKLSMSDYAEGMCDEAIAPVTKQREDLYKSSEFEQRIMEEVVENDQDAQEAIDLMGRNLDLVVQTVDSMGAFNDGHVVQGPDGAELQEDLRDYLGDAKRVTENARKRLDRVDLSDVKDVSKNLTSVVAEDEAPRLYDSDRGPGFELATKLANADQRCDLFDLGHEQDTAKLDACTTERAMLITAWNAAYTSNEISGNLETYEDYLIDPSLRYFNTPTNRGATRTPSSIIAQDLADCPAISAGELQDQ